MTVRMIFEAPPVSENQALTCRFAKPSYGIEPGPYWPGHTKEGRGPVASGPVQRLDEAMFGVALAWWRCSPPQERQTEVASVTNATAGGTAAFRHAGGEVIQRIGSPPIRDLTFVAPYHSRGASRICSTSVPRSCTRVPSRVSA